MVNEEEVYRRLREASKEIENYREYGYILVNDILDRAVAQLEAIVLAERFYRNGETIAYRSRRVLEVAAACLQTNSQERLKPVLEAFGILGSSGQQQLPFGDDPMTIETSFDSNYRKVLVAARRARQLQNGSRALVPTHSNKACRIAQEEIEAGKIAYVKTGSRGRQAAGGRPRNSDPAELERLLCNFVHVGV